jgi:DNA uptake protein ComE-like DNA-binding protein
VVLLPVLAIIIFSEPIYSWWVSRQPVDFSAERKELDSLYAHWQLEKKEGMDTLQRNAPAPALVAFNPNTIDSQSMINLGFSKQLAKGIKNYRLKGGVFRVKSDLKKMYGMDSVLYGKLKPFILLPESVEKQAYAKGAIAEKKRVTFDLNTADTTTLKSIYGIGSKLAMRIIKYRDKLGGFIHPQQVYEVYGLDSTVVSKLNEASFIASEFQPVKLNINTADERTLSSHPYLNKKIASAIVVYRYQHGNFQSTQEIMNVRLIDKTLFEKLNPYLSIHAESKESGN